MITTTALSRNGEAAPPTSDGVANGHAEAKDNGSALVPETQPAENGHAPLNGKHRKRNKRRNIPSSRITIPAEPSADDTHPALAVFCWENPDTLIGQSVAETVAALARRSRSFTSSRANPSDWTSPAFILMWSASVREGTCSSRCWSSRVERRMPSCTSSPAAVRTSP